MLDRRTIVLSVALLIGYGVLETPAKAAPDEQDVYITDTTRRLLKENRLKKVAKKEPAEAIRMLDELRSTEDPEIIAIAIAQVALDAAGRETPHQAKGLYLRAAAETYDAALDQARGGTSEALRLQRAAVEGLIRVLQEADSEAVRGGIDVIEDPLGSYELTWLDAGDLWTAATHKFEPASALRKKKNEQVAGARGGLGVPLVAVRKDEDENGPERAQGLFKIYEHYYPLTAVLELRQARGGGARRAVLRLIDPQIDESQEIDGTAYRLVIDLGAQYAAMRRNTDAIFAKKGILHAGKYMSLTSLYLMEPLRPGRIPLVLIHGLGSSPVTWTEPAREFLEDPKLRQAYQVWLFAYPTALPFPYAGMLLRRSLNEAMDGLNAQGAHPNNGRVLMIAHSMGGLLTRMQITDTGPALWDAVFTVPPEEIDLTPEEVERITEVLIVEPLPFIERVVFFSTPHRGSKYAANAAGKIGAGLVRLPKELAESSKRILTESEYLTEEAVEIAKMPDSVQSLRPDHPLILALNTLPIDSRVTYHTIVGDRGKGSGEGSSDGVVPYWSSHLDGAESEKSVPSGHGSHKHEQGVHELVRILYLHVEEGRVG